MKTFLSIIFVLMTFQISAQNYRTANTTQTTYYEQTIGWQTVNIPFKADNFNVQSNGDTLIYFLEILDNSVYTDSLQLCIDTASTPSQGEKVLLKPDGTDIYYNENNEPITIKTTANLGETWLLFDENIKIEATLSQIAMQNILGVMDSVKTLTLQVFDNLNNPISHLLNGETFELSQHFGFVSIPNFYNFPNDIKRDLKGVQNSKLGVYNLTRNDVYDFNVGDEFHIEEGNIFSKHYYKVFILSKQLDVNNHWKYTYDVVRHVFWEYDFDTNSDTAIELSGTVPQQLLPQTIVDLSALPMIFHQDSSGIGAYSKIEPSNINNRVQKVLDGAYWMNYNNCWDYAFLFGVSYMDTYIEGVGGPYGGGPISGNGVIATLKYYKKGNETYGTPINFNQILPTTSVIDESQNLKIYPNPTQDFITVELENQSNFDFNILIINNLGKIVQQETIKTNTHQIAVNHLPKGIYILRIENDATVYIKRFVKD